MVEEETVPLLALPWKRFDVEQGLGIGGKTIRIVQETNRSEQGTGLILWDSAVVLSKYLEKHPHLVKDKDILELGAGIGLVSIACEILEAKTVIATDLQYSLGNLTTNAKKNKCQNLTVREFDWNIPNTLGIANIDVFVAADVIWLTELVDPLVKAVTHIFNAYPRSTFILANQTRSLATENEFFKKLQSAGAKVVKVQNSEHNQDFHDERISIYKITMPQ